MKTTSYKPRTEQGSILFVVLVATAVLGFALAGYLRLVSTQNYSVARSQAWNRTIPVLEGGIEEAMSQINKSPTSSSLIANGWTLDGTNYVKKGSVGGEPYVAKIALLAFPIIESRGYSRIPISNGEFVSRAVRVTTKRTSLFTKALAAEGLIDLLGNNVTSDSFDSAINPIYSSSVRRANGDIATNGQLVNVGNANIYGHVATGPGGTSAINSNGTVGDMAWHAGGNSGIQDGYATDDMNVEFPPVVPPYTVGLPPTSGTVGGTNYAYVLSGTGTQYSMSSLNLSGSGSNNKMYITGDVTLYLSGNMSISGGAGIIIAPGAKLTIFSNGSTTSIAGNGVVNETGNAANFSYYGTPNNTTVSYSGNAAYVGTLYAPSAQLTLGGGGKTTYDFVGAAVANTVQLSGNFNFHYDEDLGKATADGLFVVTSWNEMEITWDEL